MKKLLATLLALSLVLCFALTANAAMIGEPNGVDNLDSNNTASQVIQIKLNDSTTEGTITTPTIYMVDIVWETTELVYNITGAGTNQTMTWNPQTHRYELSNEGGSIAGNWVDDDFTITVTNHSNANINAAITLPEATNGVNFASSHSSITVDRADEGESLGDYNKAPSKAFTVIVSGTPTSSFNIDTTVTITPAP